MRFCTDKHDLKILFNLSNKKENIEAIAETDLEFAKLHKKHLALLKSFQVCGIDLSKISVYQNPFVDSEFCQEFNKQKDEFCIRQLENIKDQDVLIFYDRFLPFVKILENKINNNTLNTSHFETNKIAFHPTGTKDGRLSSVSGLLNVYSVSKEDRHHIKSDPSFRFVQFDYRNFQPRLAIFLTDDQHFRERFLSLEDIYSTGNLSREEQKLLFFRTMYGIDSPQESSLMPIFKLRKKLFQDIKNKGKILNLFGRPIWYNNEEEHVVFRNYITSCEADFVYQKIIEIDKLLEQKKSKICFPFHDAIVFQIHNSEIKLIKDVKKIMENFESIKFPVQIKQGENFGDMKTIKEVVQKPPNVSKEI